MGAAVSVVSSAASCVVLSCFSCFASLPLSSRASRISWALYLLLGALFMALSTSDFARTALDKTPFLLSSHLRELCKETQACNVGELFSIVVTYRLALSLAIFYAFFSVLMIGVQQKSTPRASLQDGFWAPKLFILVAIFALLQALVKDEMIISVITPVVMAGAFFFIVVQLVVLVDLAYQAVETVLDVWEEHPEASRYLVFMLLCTAILFGGSIFYFVMIGLHYTNPTAGTDGSCGLHWLFLVVGVLLSVVAVGLSIHPAVQDASPRSGLLQAAMVTFYGTVFMASAVSDEPKGAICTGDSATVKAIVDHSSQIFCLLLFVATLAHSSLASGYDDQGVAGRISRLTNSGHGEGSATNSSRGGYARVGDGSEQSNFGTGLDSEEVAMGAGYGSYGEYSRYTDRGPGGVKSKESTATSTSLASVEEGDGGRGRESSQEEKERAKQGQNGSDFAGNKNKPPQRTNEGFDYTGQSGALRGDPNSSRGGRSADPFETPEHEEDDRVPYNYSLYHITLMLGALYLCATMTGFHEVFVQTDSQSAFVPSSLESVHTLAGHPPENTVRETTDVHTYSMSAGGNSSSDGKHTQSSQTPIDSVTIGGTWHGVWIQMSSGWLGILIYIWSLVAPMLFPDRHFS